MSKALSLKMDETVFAETETILKKINIPRNAYINKAVDFYNRCQRRKLAKKMFQKDMALLREGTQEIIRHTELLEDLPE